ncbi:hypothetical protein MNBD_IGNAVI01-2034 [hydrothermal vent metagenome]|uniref:Secretion system C-terminal sorting domain-containing protein n=1 Tax=hydrothermal vent metagenome TaxID=652676 RepID=A0A3B1BNM9_9ZZZZ
MSYRIKIFLVFHLFSSVIYSQFTNQRVSPTNAYYPEEVTIAINPKDLLEISAGSNLNYFYISSTSGEFWDTQILTSSLGVWGDPCVVYDVNGNIYYAHLSNPAHGNWIDRIVVQKSIDSGRTWSNGVGIGLNSAKAQDKEWLAVDHSNSDYGNNIYVSWTEFDQYGSSDPNDSTRILFSYSADEGETWSEPIKISDTGGDCLDEDNTVEGAVPAVGPNGEIYIAWAGPLGIMFDRSFDGGQTFGKDIFVDEMPDGWDYSVPGISRCNGLPITACDISKSEYRGNVYVGWSDQRNGTNDTDIFFRRSRDKGETWDEVVRVNNDTTERHQFLTWMTVDSTSGNIYFVFYDRRNTTDVATDVYLARSTNGGETFQNYLISESSFVPNPSVFFGDYTGIAAYKGIIKPIWMRLNDNVLSVWSADITDAKLDATSVSTQQSIVKNYALFQNYPNPFNPSTIISYSLPERSNVSITIYDILGNKITDLFKGTKQAGVHEVEFVPDNNLSSGIYFYKISTPKFKAVNKMLLLK